MSRQTSAVRVSTQSISKFFSGGRFGATSNYGSMCEAAAVTRHASVRCRVCSGQGFRVLGAEELEQWRRRLELPALHAKLEDTKDPADRAALRTRITAERDKLRAELSAASTCGPCAGTGRVAPKRADRAVAMDSMWTTVRCGRCRGTGETIYPNDESAERQDVCLRCGGQSYLVPVTARETGSSRHGRPPQRVGGDDDGDAVSCDVATASWNEDELLELGRVSRVLEHMRAADREAAEAFESYNGPDGDRWGAHHWGRIFALWPHTVAGDKLAREAARRSRMGHGFLLPPLALIASERDAELRGQTSNPRRRALISQADAQARRLLERANAAFDRAQEEVA
jgi:hypothetical protein